MTAKLFRVLHGFGLKTMGLKISVWACCCGAYWYRKYLRQMFNGSYKRYGSYLRPSSKFHRQQVQNGTTNGTFGAMYQEEKLGLVAYQNVLISSEYDRKKKTEKQDI